VREELAKIASRRRLPLNRVPKTYPKGFSMTPDVSTATESLSKHSKAALQSRLLRTREAAAYLAVSQWKIRELVRNGGLPVIDEGNGSPWRFDVRDLDAYIERHRRTE
jgi:excisionase family DNA binding protein